MKAFMRVDEAKTIEIIMQYVLERLLRTKVVCHTSIGGEGRGTE